MAVCLDLVFLGNKKTTISGSLIIYFREADTSLEAAALKPNGSGLLQITWAKWSNPTISLIENRPDLKAEPVKNDAHDADPDQEPSPLVSFHNLFSVHKFIQLLIVSTQSHHPVVLRTE